MKNSLFARYDPLERVHSPLSEKYFETVNKKISIRPVWIIGDLATIYDWLNVPLRKSNWHFNHDQVSVMQHYNRILRSDTMQSFMIEQDRKSVIQFDLMPLSSAGFLPIPEYMMADYAINYLYLENFRDPDVFKRGLAFFTAYVFSYPNLYNIFLRLPGSELVLRNTLESIGFQQVHLEIFFDNSSEIYKISR